MSESSASRVAAQHLAGYPVGANTWRKHGCRCEDCGKAASGYWARTNGKRRAPQPKPVMELRESVECAIARGLSTSEVMAKLGISYEYFTETLERMAA